MPKWDGSSQSSVDLADLLDATTMEALIELVGRGALVSFGTSKDGGALSVHVRAGDIRNREWFRDSEELHEWLWAGLRVVDPAAPGGPSNVQALRAR